MPSLPPLAPGLLQNATLLWMGLGLATVPIVIHLLNRRRVQHIPWAAMTWLLAAVRRHQRRLRMENWLLLLLRVAAVVLLGLALARPVVTDPALAGVLAGKRSVYVVFDNSYSMQAKRDARSVEDVAKSEADAVLAGLSGEDAVSVVLTNDPRSDASDGRAPFVLVPRTAGGEAVARAREALAAVRTRDAPAALAETLALAQGQMSEEDANRLVVVVTDFQARDWDARGGAADEVARLLEALVARPAAIRIIDVGGTDRSNLVVADVSSPMRRDVFRDRPMRVSVTVENHGPAPLEGARVAGYLDGNATPLRRVAVPPLAAQDASTGAPGSQTVTFDVPGSSLTEPGSHALRVEVLPPPDAPGRDALGLDSERWHAFRVRDRIHVLAWVRTSADAALPADAYLRAVFERYEIDDEGRRVERSSLYDLTVAPTEGALAERLARPGAEGPDLVVLANTAPRGEAARALEAFVRGGGALLAFVGDRVDDPAALNDPFYADPERRLLPFPFEGAEVRDPRVEDQAPFLIDLETSTGHPLAGPFTDEDASAWVRLLPLATWGRMTFAERPVTPGAGDGPTPAPGGEPDEGHVVFRFTDGRAAVVEGGLGLGRTLWVGTSLDHGWFERALPFFLPVFLDESAVYLTRPDQARRNLEVGRRIVVTWLPRDATGPRFHVPRGGIVTPTLYEGLTELDRPVLIQDRVGTAGVWRLTWQREDIRGAVETVEEDFAVNPDASEGALRRADPAGLVRRLPEGADVVVLASWSEIAEDPGDVTRGEATKALLWALLGLLAVESLLAWLFGRRGAARASADAEGAPR